MILIAFIWGVNFIKGHNFFSPNNSYYAVYPSSGGLQTGRVVKINGVTVGLVSDIRFYSPDLDSVVVRFDVDKKYRFTRNSIVEIGSGTSLMSDVEIHDSELLFCIKKRRGKKCPAVFWRHVLRFLLTP